jgi:hypothetical protein
MFYKIVETDNFNRDYPAEKFLSTPNFKNKDDADSVAEIINRQVTGNYPRFWKVVTTDYVLAEEFYP